MSDQLSIGTMDESGKKGLLISRATHFKWGLACLIVFLLTSCKIPKREIPPNTLENIQKGGELVVLTRNTSTTYYEGPEGPTGFEHDLVQAFANYLGVKVRFVIKDSVSEVLTAMENGEGDIAAAGLTRTEKRDKKFLFGPDYFQVQQQVVCRRGNKIPKTLEDLPNFEISLIKDSSYAERMEELKEDIPELTWHTVSDMPTAQLLERVWKKELKCVISDSNIVAINRRYFPELIIAFPITEEQPLGWILKPGSTELKAKVEHWLDEFEQSNQLVALKDRYFSYLPIFDYFDIRTYHKRIRSRLPRYEAEFKKAAKRYELPWTLLAAQAYQESHWERNAKSPTGVRGIMMLTQTTAKQVGVKNRLDPRQSIQGGAKYLSQLLERIPPEVAPADRVWFALAAYNVGMGHIYDARMLAEQLGKDPDQWHDLKTILPLLSRRKYYKNLKRGYARGSEPVRYVQRIREFYDILNAYEAAAREEDLKILLKTVP